MRIIQTITIMLLAALLGGCAALSSGGPETVVLINCGASADQAAADGRVWQADRDFSGGDTVQRPMAIVLKTEDAFIYLNERYDPSAYRIPLENGTYELKLHFAETYYEIYAAGQRVFTVTVEGAPVLAGFDPFAEAGKPFATVVKTVPVTVSDGELTIGFEPKVQSPMINGIEVLK